jgi:hypothetical protein
MIMSASSKINDSPRHFMVLQAIARGFDTVDKIAAATRKSEEEARRQVICIFKISQLYSQ